MAVLSIFCTRPNESVRREIVAELFIQFIHSCVGEPVPFLNIILEIFYREAAATAESKQTSESLRNTMHQGMETKFKNSKTEKMGIQI